MENEIKFVKMFYTMDYDTLNMKSRRPLLRAYQKAEVNELIENDCPFVIGYIYDGSLFEYFTSREIISNGNLVEVSYGEVFDLYNKLSDAKKKKIIDIIGVMFFKDEIDLGFDITNIYEMGDDRRLQWKGYQVGLTDISPYDRDKMNDYTIAKVKSYNSK